MIYSLWLTPQGKVYDKFKKLINDLSKKFDAPCFEPHLTLIGEIEDSEIFEKTQNLAKQINPFLIRLHKIDFLDSYFRCVFVKAGKTIELMEANSKAQELFSLSQEFMPHLSILYGNFPKKFKQDLVKEIGNIDETFLAESISVIKAGQIPEEWSVLKRFPLAKL